jgi:hypothetical protein
VRVVHVITELKAGGAELMLLRLADELDEVEHIVISLTDLGAVGERLNNIGVIVYAVGFNSFNFFFRFSVFVNSLSFFHLT